MNLLNVTMPTGLFVFFLLLAFIIGLLIAFWASISAMNASFKEHKQEQEMRIGYKAETFS
ncbi:MAG TPA: hypothetical protein VK590_11545 [Saprospiraceae bacterium]|nr:hypothetical protein [Saprospiraceae bacterium]